MFDEITIQELLKAKYSGSIDQMAIYLNLAIQTAAVLVAGIVLWRMSVIIHKKKKAQRVRNTYFESAFSKGWKK